MSHDAMFTEGGIAAFRCFRHYPGGYLGSLMFGYLWKPGEQEADAIPQYGGGSGFWGFKTLPEAIFQEGRSDTFVFALTEHWGKMVEHETGLRSQFAEIMAFIEPVRPAALAVFPREDLARNYPDVPVIHQRDIRSKIEELGMVTLPKATQSPMMQWSGPDGELVWAPESVGPSVEDDGEYEMLPAAATYPDDTHPADQRLRKASFEDAEGDRYVFWKLVGTGDGYGEVGAIMRPAGEDLYRHRVESQAAN
jgi:hypothetical protein